MRSIRAACSIRPKSFHNRRLILTPGRKPRMSSTVFDSELFRDMFGTAEMRAIFSDAGYLARCLEVEAALARARAAIDMIPAAAAREISGKATLACLDFPALKRETEIVGYPI